jgi:photosystem I reaction center subunit XII
MLTDTQVFVALFVAMITGLLAIQLAGALYN